MVGGKALRGDGRGGVEIEAVGATAYSAYRSTSGPPNSSTTIALIRAMRIASCRHPTPAPVSARFAEGISFREPL